MIERVARQSQIQQVPDAGKRTATGGFAMALQAELTRAGQEVQFSKHAMTRAEERGIEITQAKGATNVLAMDTEKAFIINVPHGKVITAITQDEMKDSVFTNIDGAVFL